MNSIVIVAAVIAALAQTAPPASPHRLHGSLPAVSPNGRDIVFVSNRDEGTWDLYVVDRDGARTARLTKSAEEELVPGWAAKGQRVFFTTRSDETMSLHVVDRNGRERRTLATHRANALALSNGGRRLASAVGTWRRNRLLVSNLDGSDSRGLTDSSGGSFNLAWSPDDRRVAYTHVDSVGDMQVWVVNADGSEGRALTRFSPEDGRPQWPAWSPDGRTIAVQAGVYDRQDPSRSSAHIWLIDAASGHATKLAPHAKPYLDETPSWFPNGKRLAFQSDRTGRMEIWTMRADGSRPRQVTK